MVTSNGIPLDSPLLPWRRSHKDPVSGHWLDSYGNRIDRRSWRVPYMPIEEWKRKTDKQKVTLYEQFREQTLERYGFDIASERRPPGWLPHTPVPSAAGRLPRLRKSLMAISSTIMNVLRKIPADGSHRHSLSRLCLLSRSRTRLTVQKTCLRFTQPASQNWHHRKTGSIFQRQRRHWMKSGIS